MRMAIDATRAHDNLDRPERWERRYKYKSRDRHDLVLHTHAEVVRESAESTDSSPGARVIECRLASVSSTAVPYTVDATDLLRIGGAGRGAQTAPTDSPESRAADTRSTTAHGHGRHVTR